MVQRSQIEQLRIYIKQDVTKFFQKLLHCCSQDINIFIYIIMLIYFFICKFKKNVCCALKVKAFDFTFHLDEEKKRTIPFISLTFKKQKEKGTFIFHYRPKSINLLIQNLYGKFSMGQQ